MTSTQWKWIGYGLIALALIILFFATKKWGKQWWQSSKRVVLIIGLMLLSMVIGGIITYVYCYKTLAQKKLIATLSIQKQSAKIYQVTMRQASGQKIYRLKGDTWGLQALIRKWDPWVNLTGLSNNIRLTRLVSYYQNKQQGQQTLFTTSYILNDPQTVPINTQANRFWLESVYGTATYMPLRDGAIYKIYLTDSGLMAKASNKPAQNALGQMVNQQTG